MARPLAYGSWKSPVTAELVASASVRLDLPQIDGWDIYWLESRPSEGGRNVIVRRSENEEISEVTPPGFNVRSRVHEYGGGAYTVYQGHIYFSNDNDDGRIYRQSPGAAPEPLSRSRGRRYADLFLDSQRQRLVSVCEDHGAGAGEPINMLVSIDLAGGAESVLASGSDFYSSPRLSRSGSQLAWLSWNRPDMPWDSTELWLAQLDDSGVVAEKQIVAGGDGVSIAQPEWSPDDVLHFISDESGWWNLYRREPSGLTRALAPRSADFARPQWVFGQSSYAFAGADSLVVSFVENGNWQIALLDADSGRFAPYPMALKDVSHLRSDGDIAVFCGGSSAEPTCIALLDLNFVSVDIIRRSLEIDIDKRYFSVPEPIEFPTENGQTAHAFFYRPQNPDFEPLPGELPPLLVKSHGGPTSAASSTLSLLVQYWTSRGFAVIDVNYGGSTGYGREYRERLYGNWGVVDVNDCVNAARYLAAKGEVDGNRLAISGGSAGGYTTLCALTFHDTFKAGASYYGISDLEALEHDTHKFESRYNHNLIGPYPERQDLYRQRSPIHYADQLSCPVIFFQGLEDRVVPPSQAEVMVAALQAKGVPVAYVAFAGEQHGFRSAQAIKRALEAELYFYSRVFQFAPADSIEPVEIANETVSG